MSQEFELIAKTFQGLEDVLAKELIELGANDVQIGRRMVSFTGDKAMMYKANFCLRTAIRILKPIKHFQANDADTVYEQVKQVPCSRLLRRIPPFQICCLQGEGCHRGLFPRENRRPPIGQCDQSGYLHQHPYRRR